MKNLSEKTIGFLGAGNMAGAMLQGLAKAGFPSERLVAFDTDASKVQSLHAELGLRAASSAKELAATSDIIVLAVKPQVAKQVLSALASELGGKLLLSIAAGLSTKMLSEASGPNTRVIRSMPNTPALALQGMSAFCPGPLATEADLKLAASLLGACGKVVQVDETMMDAVTGLSGSGPAYVMLIIEALSDGGVRAGLPRPIATLLATQTVLGSAELLVQSGKHPGELKDAVTSPGGTTIAGLHALEQGGLRGALIDAVFAATRRSRELSGNS